MAAQLHGNSNTCEQSYVFDGCIKRMQAYNTWREYSPSTPALGKKKKTPKNTNEIHLFLQVRKPMFCYLCAKVKQTKD